VLLAGLAHGLALILAELAVAVFIELLEHFRRWASAGRALTRGGSLSGGHHAGAEQDTQCH
jgi:hypothetical protein